MTGEEFYRNNYPKIRELALMDREVIYLLDTYADDFNKKYTIEEVRVKFEERFKKHKDFITLDRHDESFPIPLFVGIYVDKYVQGLWNSYLQAYKDLGLLEE